MYLKRCDSFAVVEASDSPLKNEGKDAVIYRSYTYKMLPTFVQIARRVKWIKLSQ